MVSPDPAANKADERLELITIGRTPLIRRADQQTSRTFREFRSIITTVEEGKPCRSCERRYGLARERAERRSPHQHAQSRRNLIRRGIRTSYVLQLCKGLAP